MHVLICTISVPLLLGYVNIFELERQEKPYVTSRRKRRNQETYIIINTMCISLRALNHLQLII